MLKGNYDSEEFRYLKVELFPCDRSTPEGRTFCQPESVLIKYFENLKFRLSYVEQIIDFNNFENSAIENFVNTRQYLTSDLEHQKRMNLYIRPAIFEKEDTFFQFGIPVTENVF